MTRRYSTIILAPGHKDGKFKKLRISHRAIFSLLSFLTSSIMLAAFFLYSYFTASWQQVDISTTQSQVLQDEVVSATRQLGQSLVKLEKVTSALLDEQRRREQQLMETRRRYEALRALAAGQEKIAEAHRLILERRSAKERLIELLIAFLVGVMSSLAATWLWYLRNAKSLSEDELRPASRE